MKLRKVPRGRVRMRIPTGAKYDRPPPSPNSNGNDPTSESVSRLRPPVPPSVACCKPTKPPMGDVAPPINAPSCDVYATTTESTLKSTTNYSTNYWSTVYLAVAMSSSERTRSYVYTPYIVRNNDTRPV